MKFPLWVIAVAAGLMFLQSAWAVDLAALSEGTWDEFSPQGKEVDAIYGDYVLRNEQIIAVIAQPLTTRNANMTVRGVGGCLIDLTERKVQNDQLSCYYPGAGRVQFVGQEGKPAEVRILADGAPITAGDKPATAKAITLEIDSLPQEGRPQVSVRYTLADGSPQLLVETIYANKTDKPIEDDLADAIRADRTFTFGFDPTTHCFWADDEWFRQSYGVVVPGYEVKGTGQRGTLLQLHKDGNNLLKLEPGKSLTIARQVFPASSLLATRGRAAELAGQKTGPVNLEVVDADGPVPQAKITVTRDGQPYATGRTGTDGKLVFPLPEGKFAVTAESLDGRKATWETTGGEQTGETLELDPPSYVAAKIVNSSGQPTPAKVSFTGKDGTPNPNWGPDSGDSAVLNVIYSRTGEFKQVIAPGKYDVIVSLGPEYDAIFTSLEVPTAGTTELKGTLKRTVDSTGWISSDFHSHSTPSGDNTSSQLGRVQNLLCEHIEFAPCTEHNRIDTYVPHLKGLNALHLMATCTGMELTGGPLPVNHQNAFPLLYKPHTQDGGAPVTDTDPVVQVQRLALWDNGSEKLVQMNHPNLPQILGDRNEDGQPDAGFERMFGFVDVIEVHPPQGIFTPPAKGDDGKLERNPIFHWMQMLNLGYRRMGVVNTDAHYNHHGSGYFRNYIHCSTDDPAHIDTMEMVRESEKGHLTMGTGPFLTVEAIAPTADGKIVKAIPGDNLLATEGECSLHIRVQCPNWLDINRVQVFVNGRAKPELNFTRRTTPDRFSDKTVRFETKLPIKLSTDTHLIVGAIGEGLTLGPVMGKDYGSKLPPVAVSNPIFVDTDGAGFIPNRDLLDVPLALPMP